MDWGAWLFVPANNLNGEQTHAGPQGSVMSIVDCGGGGNFNVAG